MPASNSKEISLPFQLPPPPGFGENPRWTGTEFEIGDVKTRVLSYYTGRSGWTDELTSFHECIAGEDHYIDRASRRHTMVSLRRWMKTDCPVVMDIGCSSGLMLKAVLNAFPRGLAIGADYVSGPLETLGGRLPGIPLIQFDLTSCPLPDMSVDAIVLLNVLEHIEHDEDALAQVARILKPGGVAVIEVPAGPNLYDVYDKMLMHHRRYRMCDLLEKISRARLQVLERSHLGFLLYPAFWATKKLQKRHLNKGSAAQREIVARNISTASSHPLMHKLMEFEERARGRVSFPFGIRCLVTCGSGIRER